MGTVLAAKGVSANNLKYLNVLDCRQTVTYKFTHKGFTDFGARKRKPNSLGDVIAGSSDVCFALQKRTFVTAIVR